MDPVTAGAALVAVQLCVALIMAGTFYATPDEQCTRYWAQSGVLIGIGVLVVITNAGAPNYALLIIGNNSLIAGLVFQWWGLQAFHGRRPNDWGWVLLGSFFLLFALLLATKAEVADRATLSAMTSMLVFILNFQALWRDKTLHLSFASVLAMAALIALITGFGLRTAAGLWHHSTFLPTTTSAIGVVVVYLVPLVGTLLFSVALLLLYFEKMVQNKHHLATHDELTGLLNRRAIITGAEREIDVARRVRQSLAVAYIDVDYFKKINDELGHENGDRVLAELAQVLNMTCRNTDLVGRYGGEEFCVIFPGVDWQGAEILSQKIINAVREHRFYGELSVTVSIGLAVLPAGSPRRSWTSLIKQADAALYAAKELGRDQFCSSSERPIEGARERISVP